FLYAWWLVISILPLVAVAFTVFLVWPGLLDGLAGPMGDVTSSILTSAVVTWFLLRFVLLLPGLVVGERISLIDSWEGTRPLAWDILVASVLSSLIFVPFYAASAYGFGGPGGGLALSATSGGLLLLVEVVLLTTTYARVFGRTRAQVE
ncbi:MAG: hypothetical protein ACU0CI_13575, partial [Shimia sp.]